MLIRTSDDLTRFFRDYSGPPSKRSLNFGEEPSKHQERISESGPELKPVPQETTPARKRDCDEMYGSLPDSDDELEDIVHNISGDHCEISASVLSNAPFLVAWEFLDAHQIKNGTLGYGFGIGVEYYKTCWGLDWVSVRVSARVSGGGGGGVNLIFFKVSWAIHIHHQISEWNSDEIYVF